MTRLAQIWRHPVKGIGAEPLSHVELIPGARMPGDRIWSIVQEGAKPGAQDGWIHSSNFIRGAKAPTLMAVTAQSDGARITFSHPELDDISVDMAAGGDALMDWIKPLYPANRSAPEAVVATPFGMTDAAEPFVSLMSLGSLKELGEKAGATLDTRRFRGNLWIEGPAPWAEFGWIGETVSIGDVRLEVVDRIDRCRAPNGNPATGAEDHDILKLLDTHYGHADFGVFARVVNGGRVAEGDPVSHP